MYVVSASQVSGTQMFAFNQNERVIVVLNVGKKEKLSGNI